MSDIVGALHADHVNFARVARLAEHALDELEAGRTTDLSLLEEIMRYVTGFPDTHHHPTEDVVFKRLSERDPGMRQELDAMLGEHEGLIAAGRSFLDAIEAAEEDAMVERLELVRLGREYLTKLRRHMDVEEARLFPAARAKLTEADWSSVGEEVDEQADPLFGPSRDEEYRRLWQRIELHEPSKDDVALADRQCVPCRGGVPPLAATEAAKLLEKLDDGWTLNADGHLERAFAFGNFAAALAFANRVGEIAEAEAHHPDLYVRWGQCRVEIWTHKIDGLTESDFFLAAKIDRAWSEQLA